MYDSATGDSKHWEEGGTNYESDRLPYLVSGYGGDDVAAARQDAGLTVEELAEELDVDEDDLFAVEGRSGRDRRRRRLRRPRARRAARRRYRRRVSA